jgi:hypothetical protein
MNQPSVTQLLSLLDKPALLKWANKIGLEGISLEEHNRKSKAVGNSMHKQVEDKIRLGKEIEDETLRKNFDYFFSGSEIIESEKVIENEHLSSFPMLLLPLLISSYLFFNYNMDFLSQIPIRKVLL